jgi:predicted TPR repeat methyltransferase
MNANPAKYDALICADTLCYFGELSEAMQAAVQALRPSGLLVFTVEAWKADDGQPYHLQPHGRYAHQRDYVSAMLAGAGLHQLVLREEQLRSEAGRPVIGWLVAALRSAEPSTPH